MTPGADQPPGEPPSADARLAGSPRGRRSAARASPDDRVPAGRDGPSGRPNPTGPNPTGPNPGTPRVPAPRRPPDGDLAARQAALVDSLVLGAPDPPGFDTARLAVARRALLRKRGGAAAAVWPRLAASLGPDWPALFAASVADHPPTGALVEGWDLARSLHRRGELGDAAAVELAEREVALHYDGRNPPRRRRGPALRRVGRLVLLHVAGRTVHLGAG